MPPGTRFAAEIGKGGQMIMDDKVLATAARELRNYANVMINMGSGTNRYVAKILSLATKLDGNQPDSRFSPRERVKSPFTEHQQS